MRADLLCGFVRHGHLGELGVQSKQQKVASTAMGKAQGRGLFYLIMKLVGLKVSAEERTNKGRIDTVIELEDSFIIPEEELNGTAQEALDVRDLTSYFFREATRFVLCRYRCIMGSSVDVE